MENAGMMWRHSHSWAVLGLGATYTRVAQFGQEFVHPPYQTYMRYDLIMGF